MLFCPHIILFVTAYLTAFAYHTGSSRFTAFVLNSLMSYITPIPFFSILSHTLYSLRLIISTERLSFSSG